ncbi:replicative DNA helicase [bacterium]|nr:replicative DNA helicase [bacterium]
MATRQKASLPVKKLPPQSEEAETSVLGALLIDKDAVTAVAEFLRPQHFYNQAYGKIYEAILELYEEGTPVDLVTVAERLKKKKALKKVGGRAALAQLANSVPTASHASYYGEIVKDLHAKRELISAAATINEVAFDESFSANEALDKAEELIFSLSQRYLRGIPISLREALAESFDRLDELQKQGGGIRGIPTGFIDLDNLLAGLQKSNLIVLAARPGVGKTALGLNIARYVSVEEKRPVCIFSLEMSKEELVDRLLIRQAQIDSWKMKTGNLDEGDFSNLSEAMGILAEAPLYIDDTPALSVLEMRTKARRLQIETGLDLIIVDYLQLIRGRGLENRVQEVSEISQGLKNLARELKVPVLALSQLSRAVEVRGTQRPRLADLRESGSIEQDADVVIFLYREDEENREAVTCEVAKHRNGPVGNFGLYFNPKFISFFNLEEKKIKGK